MPWTLKEVPFPNPEPYKREIGDCYRIPLVYVSSGQDKTWEERNRDELSAEFRASGRDHAYVVQTPAGPWIVDAKATDNDGGWTVTGEWPQITASPSINIVGYYHGWLQNGVLTDDCEGRTYEGEKP